VGHLDRPSLVNVLRTCKSFYIPALDALWALEESLTSLTRLLSPDAVCTESVPSLITLARAAAALATAATAIASIVEDDLQTTLEAEIAIKAAREAVRKLLDYFTWDQILLQPWYPSYRELPDQPTMNVQVANVNTTDNMRLPPPIKVGHFGTTKTSRRLNGPPLFSGARFSIAIQHKKKWLVLFTEVRISRTYYTPRARRKHSLCSRLL
jgi:hypothetical protein